MATRDEPKVVGRLEVPGFTDLGPVHIGTMVSASLMLANRSGEDVLVNKFKPDCSCTEVYIDRGGSKERVVELLLKPNEMRTVNVDMLISGEPGLKQANSVEFAEAGRDAYYQTRILFTPIARFYTIPRVAQFGDVQVGGTARKRLELRSDGSFRRGLQDISMRSSSDFSMRFTRPTGANLSADTSEGQDLLGFVDLSYTPRSEGGEVREELAFLESGELLGKVVATASSIADITISPKTLVLPRHESGKTVYSGWFHCRSRSGKPFEVGAEAGTAEISVSIDPPDAKPVNSYKIGFAFLGEPPTSSMKKIDLFFKVKDESGERSLVSHVLIGPADR